MRYITLHVALELGRIRGKISSKLPSVKCTFLRTPPTMISVDKRTPEANIHLPEVCNENMFLINTNTRRKTLQRTQSLSTRILRRGGKNEIGIIPPNINLINNAYENHMSSIASI